MKSRLHCKKCKHWVERKCVTERRSSSRRRSLYSSFCSAAEHVTISLSDSKPMKFFWQTLYECLVQWFLKQKDRFSIASPGRRNWRGEWRRGWGSAQWRTRKWGGGGGRGGRRTPTGESWLPAATWKQPNAKLGGLTYIISVDACLRGVEFSKELDIWWC